MKVLVFYSLLFLALFLLMPMIVQWAWNNSLTPIFGIREISWLEAFSLNLLTNLLFKNTIPNPVSKKD